MRTTPDRPGRQARHEARHEARHGARRTSLAAALTAVVLLLAGCSGDGDEDGEKPGGDGGSQATDSVTTDAALGKVRGKLDAAASDKVLADVTAVVDGWLDAGYGGEYPRTDFGSAFAGFTPDAKALATKQASILTNSGVGADLDGVEVTQRVVRVDVLAPKGKLAGATARVQITMELSGGVERTDAVTGRLLLTPAKGGWKVFGFDVQRGEKGA